MKSINDSSKFPSSPSSPLSWSTMKEAALLINNVRGKKLSTQERCQIAIQLAAAMLTEAQATQSSSEKRIQAELGRMMNDPNGKAFTTSMTDQCFRSQKSSRVADQLTYMLQKYGIPRYLSKDKQFAMLGFKSLGNVIPGILVPIVKFLVRKETSAVILPGEPASFAKHMAKRRKEGVRVNLNHLGEAILGEKEAEHRLQIYLDDLAKPEIEYVSVKISTICSQLNLLAWKETLALLNPRLKQLYRASQNNLYTHLDGTRTPKFVNLDMEEFRDLRLTVDLFCQVLDDPEFHQLSAGIVLQSYLPDSFEVQKELTIWAKKRVALGRAPIKIRIVKGANLAMEQVDASLHGWPQAPYPIKADVDANFKRMVTYGFEPANVAAANIGIGSHNLFDIAYALLLRAENNVEPYVCFEMLEGMADHMRRVVQKLSGGMLLYCPTATKEEFQNAVAYLVRRLDENTATANFLRAAFSLTPGSKSWDEQAALFTKACQEIDIVSSRSRRSQDRTIEPVQPSMCSEFENEVDTDWSLPKNREWAEKIIKTWKAKKHSTIPLVIGGEALITEQQLAIGEDPSRPGQTLYQYSLANNTHIERAIQTASRMEIKWATVTLAERSQLIAEVAQMMRRHRADLIGAMVADTGKTIPEADVEVSEAIDFAEYYRRNMLEVHSLEDIKWQPKGTVLVTPPWNFPCSIPAGGIIAALAAGNCVLFKPASEAVLVGWQLVQLFWEAGISKEVLQFITCEDDPIGSVLIKDPRIASVVLTGATSTAKLFLKMRPGLNLIAETGGKNALVISNMSDRDLAVKDLVQSAFGHAGQKCSACSLAICESEVYDDLQFRAQLRDAAASLCVGSQWNMETRVNPLIHAPDSTLKKALTTLEPGEEWLLEPKQDLTNPNIWSPGIKLGVKPSSFTYQNELFGPVLGIMRAENLEQAIQLANGTPYGLTSGIHSLDEREQRYWLDRIEAGNCYVNRGITGAIVQRQPFGGCKESSFGPGAKAGGPNYLMQLMNPEQIELPAFVVDKDNYPQSIQAISQYVEQTGCTPQQLEEWHASIGSYLLFWQQYFSKSHDPSCVLGQDNLLRYVPHRQLLLRMQPSDNVLDVLRVITAAVICGVTLEISAERPLLKDISTADWLERVPNIKIVKETEQRLIKRLERGSMKRIRLLSQPTTALQLALANFGSNMMVAPVLANGRVELLRYLREVSMSIDYHRYGYLGDRENEVRGRRENSNGCGCRVGCCQG